PHSALGSGSLTGRWLVRGATCRFLLVCGPRGSTARTLSAFDGRRAVELKGGGRDTRNERYATEQRLEWCPLKGGGPAEPTGCTVRSHRSGFWWRAGSPDRADRKACDPDRGGSSTGTDS